MDSLTHLYFADKLLTICSLDRSAAVASLYPQIDRSPAYFHRMYGHPFRNIAGLRDTAMATMAGEYPDASADLAYAAQRYAEERSRMERFKAQYEAEIEQELGPPSRDPLSVTLSWASHTYQDIFNNPMQAFLPTSSCPCGKWALWESLPDPIGFRLHLYESVSIAAFREEFFSDPLWDATLEPRALAWAMIELTRRAAASPLSPALTGSAFDALEIGEPPTAADVADAVAFLEAHEALLEEHIRRHSQVGALSAHGGEGHVPLFPVGS